MAGRDDGPAIGIDLGTTYSCVGVWQHGGVVIVTNDQGNLTTPSWVAFTDSERLVGDPAKNRSPGTQAIQSSVSCHVNSDPSSPLHSF